MLSSALLALSLASRVFAQQAGTSETETHPRLTWQRCTRSGCTNVNGFVSLDANWRWAHAVGGYTNCYTGNEWNSTACPDNEACAKNCAIEGVKYQETYGISTSGNELTLKFVTKHQYGTNVGSRVYLMASQSRYEMFNVVGKEFTFDVDVSKLPCGLNGALYFIEMDADGGMGKYSTNKAGAKYGTGYCDAQCPHDMKWINGKGNVEGWAPHPDDENAGAGEYGACCPEMDIWEANSEGNAYTPHPCTYSGSGAYACRGASECGDNGPTRYDGVCDKDGCDFSAYRMGNPSYYGPGKTIDTTKKITVVTQFIGSGSTVSEMKRIYVQNGRVIQNSNVNIAGMDSVNSITDEFCDQAKQAFGDTPDFQAKGGMNGMASSLAKGHVLALSLWADFYAKMLWLDSAYPLDRDENEPGIKRGDCPRDSGDPHELIENSPDATVKFSNIKFGDIGSTFRAQ